LEHVARDRVSVERDAVAAVAVERERDAHERLAVARGERGAHRLDDRVPGRVAADDAAEEARRRDDLVVHAALLVVPGRDALEVREERLVARDPAGHVLDPRALRELEALGAREGRVEGGRFERPGQAVEEAALLLGHGSTIPRASTVSLAAEVR